MTERPAGGPLLAYLGAIACALVFACVTVAAYGWSTGTRLDAAALVAVVDHAPRELSAAAATLVGIGDPLPVLLATGALVCAALARGSLRDALLVLLLVAGAVLLGQLAKSVLAHPRPAPQSYGIVVQPRALPSGHATAAMALALAAVLVAPRQLRIAAAAAGACLAAGVGVSTVVLGWHFPSDVVAGYLFAGSWGLLVAGWASARKGVGTHARKRSAPPRRGRAALPARVVAARAFAASGAALAVLLAALAALLRPDPWSLARLVVDEPSALLFTAVVAAAAVLPLVAITSAIEHSGARSPRSAR
ncbi:phosphatase PAP2 family protein [Thermoleophilum album]|uniref:PAP2 superfamily protein n=1 Tax=Thermoleophilum album TaxID=29539 RepID=A0A1H6FYZ2_THEAL|nr:phosphatase PAP2 family protein [Thermoleophilum album]SEH15428.1 PAP2 superfamily protein [Thermoleophilum album]